VEDIADLVENTREVEGVGKVTQIALEHTEYFAMNRLMRNHRMTEEGGVKLRVNVLTDIIDAARAVPMYSVDRPVYGDVLDHGSVPWRHVETSFYIDIHEPDINEGDAVQILRHVDVKRTAALLSRVKLHETHWWGKPASSSDKVTPYGLDYWVTFPSTYSTDGFFGRNPAGFTSGCADLDSSTYNQWANWYFRWASITQNDLIAKLVKAMYKTSFVAALPDSPLTDATRSPQRELYTTFDVWEGMRLLYRAQNDNLKKDVAGGDLTARDGGGILVQGVPIIRVPFLDDEYTEHSDYAAYDPIYGVDWGTLEFVYKTDWQNRETTRPAPNQHNVSATWIDTSYNTRCTDRRRNFMGSLTGIS